MRHLPGLLPDQARSTPRYELRVCRRGRDDDTMEVWQLPSPASPHLKGPHRVAGLSGRNLTLVEHSLLRRLSSAGVKLAGLALGERRRFDLNEDIALNLGLLFRTLAPMRSRDNMRACAQGIDTMGREEAAYWLGMAMHRRNPRRVLAALRLLLTEA
jgi:hypothetical protein